MHCQREVVKLLAVEKRVMKEFKIKEKCRMCILQSVCHTDQYSDGVEIFSKDEAVRTAGTTRSTARGYHPLKGLKK